MEVGAVKQAFNNEVILLKRSLNQARIQVIHKLTRKAKVLLAKKAPEQLQAKLKRKAEAAVNEVLIMKKIKTKDLAKFIVTHKEEDLNKYLNKPTIDMDKACARLLLHKSLQEKYKQMRVTYHNIHIDDLFMSRIERQKIKKEKKELMNKKNNKNNNKTAERTKKNSISSEGDWSVENIDDNVNSSKVINDVSVNDSKMDDDSDEDGVSDDDKQNLDSDKLTSLDKAQDSGSEDLEEDIAEDEPISEKKKVDIDDKSKKSDLSVKINPKTAKNLKNNKEISKNNSIDTKPQQIKEDKRSKLPKTNKSKNKKSDERFNSKKHAKETEEVVIESNKVVDPFFKTVTGDNYMSLVEPRAPDEVKEEHYRGNRQMRRAVQFGHAPRMKPRQNFRQDNSNSRFNNDERFGKNNSYNKDNSGNKFNKNYNGSNYNDSNDKFNKRPDFSNDTFNKRADIAKEVTKDEKPEKLHPSWEAKKKISNILPFKGKKTTFNED